MMNVDQYFDNESLLINWKMLTLNKRKRKFHSLAKSILSERIQKDENKNNSSKIITLDINT